MGWITRYLCKFFLWIKFSSRQTPEAYASRLLPLLHPSSRLAACASSKTWSSKQDCMSRSCLLFHACRMLAGRSLQKQLCWIHQENPRPAPSRHFPCPKSAPLSRFRVTRKRSNCSRPVVYKDVRAASRTPNFLPVGIFRLKNVAACTRPFVDCLVPLPPRLEGAH